MYEGATSNEMSTPALIRRALLLLVLAVSAGFAGQLIGFTTQQSVAAGVFLSTILGTLLFWNLRLSIAFLGVSVSRPPPYLSSSFWRAGW